MIELEEVAAQDILRSELWTTLFRGGYMIGKLQRSLSGRYVSFKGVGRGGVEWGGMGLGEMGL